MQAQLTTKPLQQVIAAIQALDLESVKTRVTDPELGEGWTPAYADSIETAYKNYLTMLVKYQDDAEDILLSKDVDEFWHTHILQTIKYTEDCEMVFGRYLHHAPHIGEVTSADMKKRTTLAEKTRRLYEREFGNEQDYNTAWAGISVKAENAAMCLAQPFGRRGQQCPVPLSGWKMRRCLAQPFGRRGQQCPVPLSGWKMRRCLAQPFA